MSKLKTPDVIRLINHDGIILYESDAASLKQALHEAIAAGVKLKNMDLSYQDLSFANLDDGCFENVSFKGANLMGTNLSECSFVGCDFTEASFIGACLAYAYIQDCTFYNSEFGTTDINAARVVSCGFMGHGVFYLDYATLETFVNSYIYSENGQDKMAVSNCFVHVSTCNKRMILGTNKLYLNGAIFDSLEGEFSRINSALKQHKSLR